MEIPCPLRKAARRHPGAPALIAPGRTLSYADLDRAVTATAAQLGRQGIGAAARVALYGPRSWTSLVVLMAVIRQGGVACPLSTRLPPARVADRLRQIRGGWLITDDVAVARAAESVVTVGSVEEVVTAKGEDGEQVDEISLRLDQPATIMFTSGSTGQPKAALHTVGNHYFNAKGSNENITLAPGDRWCLSLPLYHVGGWAIFVRCLLAGAAAVLPSPDDTLGRTLEKERITHISMVATQLRRLLQESEETPDPFPHVRAMLVGGGGIPPGLVRGAHARGWPIHTTYGCTEMASQVTTTSSDAPLKELMTAGRLLPHRQLRIASDGEILVRGQTLFQGYVEADTIQDPRDADGWYHTGDLGRLDAGGLLHVRGRTDHLFISGGENIQPEEIERALEQLDEVVRAVVVPVPHEEYGQRPAAFVQMVGDGLSAEELTTRLAHKLPRFKIPDHFYPWPQQAGEPDMKIDRAQFRRWARDRREVRL